MILFMYTVLYKSKYNLTLEYNIIAFIQSHDISVLTLYLPLAYSLSIINDYCSGKFFLRSKGFFMYLNFTPDTAALLSTIILP